MTMEDTAASCVAKTTPARMPKPYAEACERNQGPILEVLKQVLASSRDVLEIGSGTGQHAVYLGAHLPHLVWHTSDLPEHHPGIAAWIEEAGIANVRQPLALDVSKPVWPVRAVDAVFSANTLHIMAWAAVECMFRGIARVLERGGVLCVYGPFNYGGRYTSPSNASFDAWLKSRNPLSGIRDFESVDDLAGDAGMALLQDFAMPANNRCLVWRRSA
jgi:SAM-dependent methyltransferase